MQKAAIASFIMFISCQTFSQSVEDLYAKKLLIGFNIGYNYSNVLAPNHSSNQAQTNNGSGFRLGLVLNQIIDIKTSLSPKAELSFNNCNVSYFNSNNTGSVYEVFPVNLDLAVHLNRKLNAYKNSLYVLAGPNVKIPISQKIGGLGKMPGTYGNNSDLAIDIGCGFNKIMPYFHFAPELRYSIGLLNINRDPSLDYVYFHNVTFVLNFKG